MSWFDAKEKCESFNVRSNLASVTNAQENEHIKGKFLTKLVL